MGDRRVDLTLNVIILTIFFCLLLFSSTHRLKHLFVNPETPLQQHSNTLKLDPFFISSSQSSHLSTAKMPDYLHPEGLPPLSLFPVGCAIPLTG